MKTMEKIANEVGEVGLPEGWEVVQLRNVGRILTGGTPSKKDSGNYDSTNPFFKPSDLDAGINIISSSDGLSDEGIRNARTAPAGSTLVTCIGATIGKTGLIAKSGGFNQQINAIIPNGKAISKLIYYQAISPEMQRQIVNNASATTLPIINKSKFELLDFVLPPLAEQERIVSKIEELFSELEKGKEQILLAQQQLKTYRQAVLKWAFEGRLTNADVVDGVLPEGWARVPLGKVCKLKNGYAFKSELYSDFGVPLLRISNIKEGRISLEDAVLIPPNDAFDSFVVRENDILVAMSGATTGKFGMYVRKELAYQNQRVGKFQILDQTQLGNRFLFYQINSLKRQIEEDAYGGAQPNISSTKIEEMLIVLPQIEEQHRIVQEIESRLSVCDALEGTLQASLAQAEVLRQSILKRAFEGRLV